MEHKSEYSLTERNPNSLQPYELHEIQQVRGVMESFLNPEITFQNLLVKGPGDSRKTKVYTLAEIDLLFLKDKRLIMVEVGSEKDESKPTMFSRKSYHLTKAKDKRLHAHSIDFLEFNGGLLNGIEVRKYHDSLNQESPDILVGVGSKENVKKLHYRQVLDAIDELEMNLDVPVNYYGHLENSI